MNIEKLIEAAKLYGIDAADALTALLAENERLQKMYQEEKAVCHATQVELEKVRESLDFAHTKDAEILRLGMELGHLKKHMERLTHRLGNGEIVCNMARDDCRKMGGDCQIDSKILERLAAYEETGLEPEEIELLAKQRTLPAADVAEVRHGRWEKFSITSGIISRVRCSVCAGTQPLTFENMPYCPNCGARMDKEAKHEAN